MSSETVTPPGMGIPADDASPDPAGGGPAGMQREEVDAAHRGSLPTLAVDHRGIAVASEAAAALVALLGADATDWTAWRDEVTVTAPRGASSIDETIFSGAPVFRSVAKLDIMTTIETSVPPTATPEAPIEDIDVGSDDEGRGGFAGMLLRGEHGDQPPGLAYTLTRSIDWMQVQLAELQMSRWNPAVTIEPQCGHVKLFDFDKSPEIIEAGRVAARKAMPEIRALLES